MAFFKSPVLRKSLTLKKRSSSGKAMNPQEILAAIEDSVHFEASLRSSTNSTNSIDSFTSMPEDEISKMSPQEILLLLEHLGSNSCDLSDSERSLQMAKAMKQLESSDDDDEDDGDFDICLDDVIPQEVSISR